MLLDEYGTVANLDTDLYQTNICLNQYYRNVVFMPPSHLFGLALEWDIHMQILGTRCIGVEGGTTTPITDVYTATRQPLCNLHSYI